MRNALALLLILSIVVSGCAHDPYRNRVLDDGNGGTKRYFFAYGKFCGPGYPPLKLKEGYHDIATETVSMWPPNDELDAMCYAHDLCYEDGGITAVCDQALQALLIRDWSRFTGQGCHRLAGDMSIAFFAHCGIKGEDKTSTVANRLVCWTVGAPMALLFAVIEAPFMLRKFPTTENKCSPSDKPDLVSTVHAFEENYRETILNPHHKPLVIPLPRNSGTAN